MNGIARARALVEYLGCYLAGAPTVCQMGPKGACKAFFGTVKAPLPTAVTSVTI